MGRQAGQACGQDRRGRVPGVWSGRARSEAYHAAATWRPGTAAVTAQAEKTDALYHRQDRVKYS